MVRHSVRGRSRTAWVRGGAMLAVLGGAVSGLGSLIPAVAAHAEVMNVVAGENFWGSLAGQLGGNLVHVTSIVTDPNADPHEYESNAADARAFAAARYVILNGAGYDDWANRLLSAQPERGRKVFTIATLLGKKRGDNPHFWYSPSYVYRVIDQITADYRTLEPQARSYFASRHAAVEAALSPYRARLAYITKHFAGTRVAATESIFQYLAQDLHLNLVTPGAFMKSVSEGVDPPASTVAEFDQQIADGRFQVLVYNRQTVSPLITTIREKVRAKKIPVIGVTETIQPPGATFERWMDGELDSLSKALSQKRPGR